MMQTFRWILGAVTALSAAGFFLLVILGNGFRRSFGASGYAGLKMMAVLLIQGALFASILAPDKTFLLHTVAIIVAVLVAGCLWISRESAVVGLTGLAYCGLWGGYYWQAIGALR